MKNDVQVNETYIPYLYDDTYILAFLGGAGSGKSVFVTQKIMIRLLSKGQKHRILCVRKVQTTLKDSIVLEIKAFINRHELNSEFKFNKTEKVFTHIPTGNEIRCIGLDDREKLKSISGITSIWIEEATELTEEDFDQLSLRLRGHTDSYKQILLSFNPINEKHWLKKRLVDDPMPNSKLVSTTYKDNAFLTEQDIEKMRAMCDINPYYYKVYFKGEWGKLDVESPFMYCFKESHVRPCKFNPNQTLYISCDFNVDPITAIAFQFGHGYYYILSEFRIRNADTYILANEIKNRYPDAHLRITGDASGNNRSTTSQVTNYQILQNELGIVTRQFDLLNKNPSLEDSRTLSNAILARHPNHYIDPSCEYLIEDLRYVEWKAGKIIKDKDPQKSHLLDCKRYADNTYFRDFLKKPNNYY